MESNSSSVASPPDRRARRRRDLILLLPGLLLLAGCGFTWGGYFWLSSRVQAAADQALRAAVAARGPAEADRAARAAAQGALSAPLTDLVIEQEPRRLRVRLSYDLSDNPVFAVRGLTPLPSPIIMRAAEGPIAAAVVAADRSAAPRPARGDGRPSGQTTAARSE